ncbi:ABC transporter ATPase [Thermococcus eurythermalis]|uniref:ABC transporter ATPase n=1 Tax=Thermococcus eurythermalis TaxID=1505907 RepID=A0A097QQV6_9EURY|nr:ATP/GTP-binding protein [Thermococcus eurythermalis]AIU68856.1 ABC transporter ATPase [Thermococcus eurythermalis]
MITSLSIKNFRGIKSLDLENFGQVNVFVGRNNVGKSSVLEAIAIALSAANRDPTQLKAIFGHVLKWRGWVGHTSLYSLFTNSQIPIELKFIAGGVPFVVTIMHPGNLTQLMETKSKLKLDTETLKNMLSESVEAISLQIKAGPLQRNAMVLVSGSGNMTVMTSEDEPYPVELPVEFVTPYDMVTPGFIETVFSKAFKVRAYSIALDLIRRAYPDVEGLSPVHEENGVLMYVDIKHAPKSIPYYSMGDGFKFLSATAFLVSSMKNGYLLIDSAEAFHHLASLRAMVRTLLEGSLKNNVQVFLTTHSLELIDMLLEEGIRMGINGRVIYMKRENGKLTHSIETFENAKELREDLGIDLRG